MQKIRFEKIPFFFFLSHIHFPPVYEREVNSRSSLFRCYHGVSSKGLLTICKFCHFFSLCFLIIIIIIKFFPSFHPLLIRLKKKKFDMKSEGVRLRRVEGRWRVVVGYDKKGSNKIDEINFSTKNFFFFRFISAPSTK